MAQPIYRVVRRLTESDLVKWLQTKVPEKPLDFVITHFFQEQGLEFKEFNGTEIIDLQGRQWGVPDWITQADKLSDGAYTYGSFLENLKEYYEQNEIPLDL